MNVEFIRYFNDNQVGKLHEILRKEMYHTTMLWKNDHTVVYALKSNYRQREKGMSNIHQPLQKCWYRKLASVSTQVAYGFHQDVKKEPTVLVQLRHLTS